MWKLPLLVLYDVQDKMTVVHSAGSKTIPHEVHGFYQFQMILFCIIVYCVYVQTDNKLLFYPVIGSPTQST